MTIEAEREVGPRPRIKFGHLEVELVDCKVCMIYSVFDVAYDKK